MVLDAEANADAVTDIGLSDELAAVEGDGVGLGVGVGVLVDAGLPSISD